MEEHLENPQAPQETDAPLPLGEGRGEGTAMRGIQFQCTRCGTCCTGAPGSVYLTTEEITQLASFLKAAVDLVKETYLYPFRDSYSAREEPNGDCVFFKNHTCSIYPVRPEQCRTFPFWIRNLRSEENWTRIEESCPGVGQGHHVSREQIEARLAQTRTPE